VKTILFYIVLGPAFLWVGFWLRLLEPEMFNQLTRAQSDGFSKYSKDES